MDIVKRIQREIDYIKFQRDHSNELIQTLQELKIQVDLSTTSRSNTPVKRIQCDDKKAFVEKVKLLVDFGVKNREMARILAIDIGRVDYWIKQSCLM